MTKAVTAKGDGLITEASKCWDPLSENTVHSEAMSPGKREDDSSVSKLRRKEKEAGGFECQVDRY